MFPPDVGSIAFPSSTSMNQRSSLYWALFTASPRDSTRSTPSVLFMSLIVRTAAFSTWVVNIETGEYA
ncbi:MAG TPA: hypothetical protein O0X69_01415, partial [Methanocorpusculum sp.]|nr:hypothetical protein [Methanocorpusculum sp.]